MRPTLEGGDVLVLREDVLAMGYSERTEKTTIERLAETLKAKKSSVKRIFVVAIPPARSYMHLDTVFTMISRDECLVYGPMILSGGAEEADVYEVDLTKREVTWTSEKDLLSALKGQKIDVAPIRCGGDDPIAERREQWTDGANAFALAPGVVLLYDRNVRTAEELGRAGYAVVDEADLLLGRSELDQREGKKCVIRLAAHELSRARGGPRCMAMPLVRADV
jgi:arginine deiminase